jgi:D-alanyl-lipoteichoic acid acyltransferase DltB (MBOAT superfamily)
MFGLRIPQNFNSPYKALDPADFWRRWHISLSTCMRDYLYIPFGGNRGSTAETYRNLMLTMLIGGLWHGAAWTFVFWGFYHGLLLAIHRATAQHWDRLPRLIRQLAMFLAAVIGWVFFRSTSFDMALQLLRTMFIPTAGVLVPQLPLVVLAIAIAALWSMRGPNAFELKHDWRWPGRLALASAFGAALALIVGNRPSPFLYFQF